MLTIVSMSTPRSQQLPIYFQRVPVHGREIEPEESTNNGNFTGNRAGETTNGNLTARQQPSTRISVRASTVPKGGGTKDQHGADPITQSVVRVGYVFSHLVSIFTLLRALF